MKKMEGKKNKRLVVKVGTKVLMNRSGGLDLSVIKHLVEQIVVLRRRGYVVVLVTSGAVGSGRSLLPREKGQTPESKQVLAAIGQVKLMTTYAELFGRHHYLCAQVLATKEDFRDRTHYLNMKNCFDGLMLDGVVPIVNENDVTATAELVFTDNDELAGLVTEQVRASRLIILSAVAGVLDRAGKVIPEINSRQIGVVKKFITRDKTTAGRGGMTSKFAVASQLARRGISVQIATGKKKNILLDLVTGKKIGTRFV